MYWNSCSKFSLPDCPDDLAISKASTISITEGDASRKKMPGDLEIWLLEKQPVSMKRVTDTACQLNPFVGGSEEEGGAEENAYPAPWHCVYKTGHEPKKIEPDSSWESHKERKILM